MTDVMIVPPVHQLLQFSADDLTHGRIMFATGKFSTGNLGGHPSNPKLPQNHNVTFDIPFPHPPQDGPLVHVTPARFGNGGTAVYMHYDIHAPNISTVDNNVRVQLTIEVGDTDGWLQALSYFCVAKRRR